MSHRVAALLSSTVLFVAILTAYVVLKLNGVEVTELVTMVTVLVATLGLGAYNDAGRKVALTQIAELQQVVKKVEHATNGQLSPTIVRSVHLALDERRDALAAEGRSATAPTSSTPPPA